MKIKIAFMPDGTAKMEVKGIKGASCANVTKFLEENLGEVEKRAKTSEYFQQPEQEQKLKQGF